MSDKPQHTPNVALLNECLNLRQALKFYRDEWEHYPGDSGLGGNDPQDPESLPTEPLYNDGGNIARQALDAGQQNIPDLLAQVERLTEQRDALRSALTPFIMEGFSLDDVRKRTDPQTLRCIAKARDVIAALKGEDDDQA